MFTKISRIILFILLISLAALLQVSAIFVFPGFLGEMNLVLVVLISILFFYNSKSAAFAGLIAGVCLDLFSFSFFGFNILSILISLMVLDRLLSSWLTNRSFYSFLFLNIISVIFYNFLSEFLFYFSNFEAKGFFLIKGSFWLSLAYQSIWSIIIAFLSFNLLSIISKKLKPVFLEDKSLEKR